MLDRIIIRRLRMPFEVVAKVRQAAAFAEHLVLTRKITMNFGESTFKLSDYIQNDGYIEEPVQLLYHINLGWPFLAPGTTLQTSCNQMLGCIDSAKGSDPSVMPAPTPKDIEQVWDFNAPGGLQVGFYDGTGAGVGLLGGAAMGAMNSAGKQNQAQTQYNIAYQQCMYSKGNQVPSYR